MLSVAVFNGKVEDITYHKTPHFTLIKLGGLTIGQIFKKSDNSYAVVVIGNLLLNQIRSVEGLSNRYYCTKFALETLGYWTN